MADKPGYQQAWDILREVDAHLEDETDAKGDLKGTGEGRALWRMRRALQGEISKDATLFLKQSGFTGGGTKRKKRKP
jgi:hypothetical protein